MLFEDRSCDMYLLHSYVPLQLSKSLLNICLSKIRVKIWDEEPYIGGLHAVPTKFRNILLSFHSLKKATAQNYEREINLIQKAHIFYALLRESFRTFLKKIAKSSPTSVKLCTKS